MQSIQIDVIGNNFHLEDLSWILTQPKDIRIYDEETDTEKSLTPEHWNSIIPHMKQSDYIGFLCSRDGTKDLINEIIGENKPSTDPVTLKDLFESVNRALKKRYKDYNTSTTHINEVIEIGRKDSATYHNTLWPDFYANKSTIGDMLGDRVCFEGFIISLNTRFSVLYAKEVNLWVIACGT